MTIEGLSVTREGAVLTIKIDRADAANALTHDIRMAMVAELETASADLAVRAVVITAEGEKAFCTGADLRSRPPVLPKPEGAPDRPMGEAARMIKTGWGKLIAAIITCEKPVIASINGTAAGGGAHLALACDLTIMSDTARLIEVFVRRGIMPDAGGAWILPRLVGIHKAKELMFFGDDVSAAEALSMGLVNRVVPAGDLAKETAEWAARLASGPTKAIGMTKWLVNRSAQSDLATSLDEEAFVQELINSTEDAKEGMLSFVERRPSEFKGW